MALNELGLNRMPFIAYRKIQKKVSTMNSGGLVIPVQPPETINSRYSLRFFVGHETKYRLLEISNFSLNNVTFRPTKIMNRANKNWTNL